MLSAITVKTQPDLAHLQARLRNERFASALSTVYFVRGAKRPSQNKQYLCLTDRHIAIKSNFGMDDMASVPMQKRFLSSINQVRLTHYVKPKTYEPQTLDY